MNPAANTRCRAEFALLQGTYRNTGKADIRVARDHVRFGPEAEAELAALVFRHRAREERRYFRLLIAVRSAESLAMPAAPHQFEPAPLGLIGVMLIVPEALKALVKALQLPFDRLVSE